jgi:hypothetical protein
MSSSGHPRGIGSGAVVALGMAVTALVLLALGYVAGWDPAWRAFGVTPLQPPFFDMHVINEYAACARKGVDPYAPRACSVVNFNIPPTWLLVGLLGINGSDSAWLSAVFIAAAAIVMVLLLRGRAWHHVALRAVISPAVMMGVERGNLDLLVLAPDRRTRPPRHRPGRTVVQWQFMVIRFSCCSRNSSTGSCSLVWPPC